MSGFSLKDLAYSKLPTGIVLERLQMESVDQTLFTDEDDLDALVTYGEQVNDQSLIVDECITVTGGLSTLVDDTMSTYIDQGLSEYNAELLKISVESFLHSHGLDVPASMIVPTASALWTPQEYSTEVIDRKNTLLSKIFSWLYTALRAIADAVKQFWTTITTSASGLEAYIDRVRVRVAAVTGEVRDKDSKINLGNSKLWLTDTNERLAKPDKQIVNTVARFEDFVTEWRNKWNPITSLQIPAQHITADQVESTSSQIKKLALDSVKDDARAHIHFVVTHSLELKQGSGEMPLLGATLKIEPLVSGNSHLADILTKSEMEHGIADAANALKVLSKLQTEVIKVDRVTQRVEQLSKNVSVKDGESIKVEDLRTALRALSKACTLSSWGWTNTTPYFLKTIKACVRYIDASTHRYGVKG